ncbi:MAG TPA: hypothetical protein VJU82_16430, partial [Acidobacteriaceae bacterium]|nr:hypothetical protein [Acidobacteriaceae bacterium]
MYRIQTVQTRVESLLSDGPNQFGAFCEALVNLPLSCVWQGYGSAIFLEFGKTQPKVKRDGA